MGSCSSRADSREEKIGKWAKEISSNRSFVRGDSERSYSDFQSSTGSRIRGELGIKKGNEFIDAIRKISR